MNEVLRNLYDRKSVRLFADRPVDRALKDVLFDAAIQAPSAGNQILYTILDIEEQAIKDELALCCDNQDFIARAPVVLVFLADCRKWYDCFVYAGLDIRPPDLGDLFMACSDALIAAQNTVVAAQSVGLGSCYIGDILENRERVVAALKLDPWVFPVSLVIYGHPDARGMERAKPARFDKSFVVRKNSYARLREDEARRMLAGTHPEETFDYDRFMKAFCERKYESAFTVEMNRSIGKYLEQFLFGPN